MAKDDYFVVSYRILTYLYTCFKAGEPADRQMFGPEALGINNGYWVNLMESLSNEGYLVGAYFPQMAGGVAGVKLINVKITEKGIDFLQNNSNVQKAARFLKGLKETIPGAVSQSNTVPASKR